MSTGNLVTAEKVENGIPPQDEPDEVQAPEAPNVMERRTIALPPKAREELKALLRTQNEAQERVRLVLGTLEEALEVPAGWVIRDVDEGFVELRAE